MANPAELSQLLEVMNRIARGLEGGSSTASSIRVGRGGNSNRLASGDREKVSRVDHDKLRKSHEALINSVKDQLDAGRRWERAIRQATGSTESFEDTVDRLERNLQDASAATEHVTRSTLLLHRNQQIGIGALKELNSKATDYASTVSKLDRLKTMYAEAETAHLEVDNQIAAKRQELANARNKHDRRVMGEELAALQQQKDALKSLASIEDEIDKTADALIVMNTTIDRGTIPAMEGFNDEVVTTTDKQKLLQISNDELKKSNHELNARVVAQSEAYNEILKQEKAYLDKMQATRKDIMKNMVDMGKSMKGVAGLMLDNFRARLQYNVMDTHYTDAASMGLSGPQLSQFVGENARMLRLMDQSGNAEAPLDGRIQDIQKHVTALYGVSGPAAMQTLADAGSSLQQAGINLNTAPEALNTHLTQVSQMADRLGMVKSELISFQKDLAESGELAYLTSKYNHLSAGDAQVAMDRELEARIANAKVLGLSTAHVKEQIQIERRNRYGTIENQIMGMIGAKMDASLASRHGANITPEMEAVREKFKLGGKLDAQEMKLYEMSELEIKRAHENAIRSASERGDKNALLSLGVDRSISQRVGSDTFTAEGMAKFDIAEAAFKNYDSTGKAFEDFLKSGAIPEAVRKEITQAGDPNAYGGPLAQMANRAGTVIEGVKASPIGPLLGMVGGILLNTGLLVAQNGLLGKGIQGLIRGRGLSGFAKNGVVRGMAARGAALGRAGITGAARGAAALGRAGIAATARGAALGRVGIAAAGASGVAALGGTAVNAGATAARATGLARVTGAAGGLIGRAAGSGVGKFLIGGGILGATVGLAGDAASAYGQGLKAEALAEEQKAGRKNDTIFDKETAGAMTDTLGKAASYGATGALIGSVIPGIGTAIGAAAGAGVGALVGVYENFDTLTSNFNTVSDKLSDMFGPSETLERSREEAKQNRQGDAAPQEVVLAGEQGEAVVKSANNSDKLVDAGKEQTNEAKKAREFHRSKADIQKMMQGLNDQVAASQQRFQDSDT